jgi:hypothetical protein
MTAVAVRARRYRQRRKNGVRCLVVEISRVEIQALVKAVQTHGADADVKRAIHALLNASYMTDRRRTAGTQSSQAVGDGGSCCAWCGLAGVVGYGPGALLPAEIRGGALCGSFALLGSAGSGAHASLETMMRCCP